MAELISVRTDNFSSLMSRELQAMREAHVFTDLTLELKHESLHCHRVVVSAHSATLKLMLQTDMLESASHCVRLHHIAGDVMKAVLGFMYTGQACFGPENLVHVLLASDYLQITELRDLCEKKVESVVDVHNALMWLEMAHKLHLPRVKSKCLQIVVANFVTMFSAAQESEFSSQENELSSRKSELSSRKSELSSRKNELSSRKSELSSRKNELSSRKSELSSHEIEFSSGEVEFSFVELSIECVQECLEQAREASHRPETILNAALGWIQHDQPLRLVHLSLLMAQINLDRCSLQGILCAMKRYPEVVNASSLLYDQLTSAAMRLSSKEAKRGPKLLVIGGSHAGAASRVCWGVTKDERTIAEVLRIPYEELQRDHSVCRTPDGFVISGGEESRLCALFSATTNSWARLQDLLVARDNHGSVVARGVLYVIGGYVAGTASQSVQSLRICKAQRHGEFKRGNRIHEMHEPNEFGIHSVFLRSSHWQEAPDLEKALCEPKVSEINDIIYVLDEYTGGLWSMDSEQNIWLRKASLVPLSCRAVCMTGHNGRLYVVGTGLFAWYSPVSDEWVRGERPGMEHYGSSLVCYDHKLLVLGGEAAGEGWGGGRKRSRTNGIWRESMLEGRGAGESEMFDFDHQAWMACPWSLPVPLFHPHALVLDLPNQG